MKKLKLFLFVLITFFAKVAMAANEPLDEVSALSYLATQAQTLVKKHGELPKDLKEAQKSILEDAIKDKPETFTKLNPKFELQASEGKKVELFVRFKYLGTNRKDKNDQCQLDLVSSSQNPKNIWLSLSLNGVPLVQYNYEGRWLYSTADFEVNSYGLVAEIDINKPRSKLFWYQRFDLEKAPVWEETKDIGELIGPSLFHEKNGAFYKDSSRVNTFKDVKFQKSVWWDKNARVFSIYVARYKRNDNTYNPFSAQSWDLSTDYPETYFVRFSKDNKKIHFVRYTYSSLNHDWYELDCDFEGK